MNKEVRGRRWMLVSNNPTLKEFELLWELGKKLDEITCLVYGAEHADEADKTEHVHVYISWKQVMRFNRMKRLFPRMRIELAKKPALACIRYCIKEGFYMAFGNVPNLEGSKRSRAKAEDLAREAVIKKVRTGEIRYQDLSDEQLLDNKLCRGVERALNFTMGPLRDDLYVVCFVSPTGWGKSWSIQTTFKNLATCEIGGSQEWILNSEQYVMLFDEFCGQIRAQKMLRYLDKYPNSVPIKGGHRPCYWRLIFICSNTRPDEWYMKEDPKTGMKVSSIPDDVRAALYRRIGYPNTTSHGETHVYDAQWTTLDDARKEMNEICTRLWHEKIEPMFKAEEIEDPDIPEVQVLQEPPDESPQHSPIIIEHEELPDMDVEHPIDSDFE